MRKGFTITPEKETAAAVKNYITPDGLQRLKDEHRFLLTRERPAVTQVVAWAASNGDRSENADYQYGKRRLRQIDRRIRFLTKRIDAAEVVDPRSPEKRTGGDADLFRRDRSLRQRGWNRAGGQHRRRRRSRSESQSHQLDVAAGARADEVRPWRPRDPSRAGRTEQLQILDVRYERIPVEQFSEPPGAEAAPKSARRPPPDYPRSRCYCSRLHQLVQHTRQSGGWPRSIVAGARSP